MSELAAGVGNRRVMSYEASKFGKNSIFVWGLYGIASIWWNFFRHYFFPIQNAFVSLPMPYNALCGA